MSSKEIIRDIDFYTELEGLCTVLGIDGVYRIPVNDHTTAVRHISAVGQSQITRAEWAECEKNATKAQARHRKLILILSRELDAIERMQVLLSEQHYALRKKLEAQK